MSLDTADFCILKNIDTELKKIITGCFCRLWFGNLHKDVMDRKLGLRADGLCEWQASGRFCPFG